MAPFALHAELFEPRTGVLGLLADRGSVRLSDFGSVDLARLPQKAGHAGDLSRGSTLPSA
jgi:hypothetical protein